MMQQRCFTDAPEGNPPEHFKFRTSKGTLKIQVSLARLGAGFGSAPADIIPNRIPAHPRGAFISVGDCDPPLRQAGY